MSGLAARLTKISVLAGLVIAVTASGGSAASTRHGPILGVVPHSSQVATTRPALRKPAMVSSPGFLEFDPSYESTINQYFTDVAAASGAPRHRQRLLRSVPVLLKKKGIQ